MAATEERFRLRVIHAGIGVTLSLAAASLVYLGLTWDQDHRPLMAAIAVLAALDALVIAYFRHRLARSVSVEFLFATWNIVHVLAAGVLCVLDGGPDSPFLAILFVSVAFAAVSLDKRYVVAIAGLNVLILAGIAASTGEWPPALVFLAAALVTATAVCATIAGERQERLDAVQEARTEMLRRLARVIEFRDTDTGGHIERMSEYCAVIARRMGWSEAEVERLRLASAMHDIGKVAVHDSVLLKPGALTPDERREMERHTEVGYEMLSGSSSDEIELAAQIALTHHERFDGTGYPCGLSGSAIPIAGRIVAVADVFDALTMDRVYRRALPVADALEILREGRGTHFDPEVLSAFEAALGDILEVRGAGAAERASEGVVASLALVE